MLLPSFTLNILVRLSMQFKKWNKLIKIYYSFICHNIYVTIKALKFVLEYNVEGLSPHIY